MNNKEKGKIDKNCRVTSMLEILIGRKKFAYDENVMGNCYEIALALITAIIENGYRDLGLFYVIGDCPPPLGNHAWVEYDNCAVDIASGSKIIMLADQYVNFRQATNVKRYNLDDLEV